MYYHKEHRCTIEHLEAEGYLTKLLNRPFAMSNCPLGTPLQCSVIRLKSDVEVTVGHDYM